MPESTRTIYNRSHADKAMEAKESRILGWATSIDMLQHIRLKTTTPFLNPLYQLYKGGSKVFFAPSQAT